MSIANRAELQLRVALLDMIGTTAEGASESVVTKNGGLAPHMGIGLGFAPNENLLIDASLGVRSNVVVNGNDTTRFVELELGPSLRYVVDGNSLRFFLGASFAWHRAHLSEPTPAINQSRVAIGPFLGVHAFLNDYVSIDPAIGVSWVSQGTRFGDQWGYREVSASGYRVLVTLALTAWLNAPTTPQAKPTPADGFAEEPPPVQARVGPPPVSREAPVASALLMPGFTLELKGNPARHSDVVVVRVRRHSRTGDQLESCLLALVDGKEMQELETRHTSAPAGPQMEEVLSAATSFEGYERWLGGRPHVRLCGRPYTLEPEHVTELRLFARLFRSKIVATASQPANAEAAIGLESAADSASPEPAGDANDAPAPEANDPPTSDRATEPSAESVQTTSPAPAVPEL